MYLFGHIGIGQTVASPWRRRLPTRPLILGTILPDLIDKPLYYGFVLATGRHGAAIGLISGTRTFGHTGLFLLLLTLVAVVRKSPVFAALALGVATHLLLDSLGNPFSHVLATGGVPLLWPLHGLRFPVFPYTGAKDQLWQALLNPYFFWTEILGLSLIFWDRWKAAHRLEIAQFLRIRRREMRHEIRQRRLMRRRSRRRPPPPSS